MLDFTGTISKMQLQSNSICYAPAPKPDDEVEQRLTITRDGRVWLARYNYGNGMKYVKSQSIRSKLAKNDGALLLDMVADYFRDGFSLSFVTDIGDWELVLTNTDGKTFTYGGSLCSHLEYRHQDISDVLRDMLQIPDLMAFDGVPEPQRIEQLEIQYQHETNPIDSLTETMTIDRLSGCFEDRIEDTTTGAIQSQRLIDGHAVRSVLDQLTLEDFSEPVPGEPDDVVASPHVGRYHVCVSTFDGNHLDLDGDYAQLTLPPKWPQIMDALESLSKRRYSSHIFSSNEYQFRKRRADELILVRVVFDTAGRSYSYRTESDYLKVGDDVIVPVGEDGKEAFATIVGIDYLGPDEVPYDLEDLKSVIRAATPADYARFNRQIPGKP